MAKNSPNISKVLQTLCDEDATTEQLSALTYIRSNFTKEQLSRTINEVQYAELCRILITLICKTSKMNKNTKHRITEAKATLQSVLQKVNYHINIFEIILRIDREEKFRILEFLNDIEINILPRVIQTSKSVNGFDDCLRMIDPSTMKWIDDNACIDNIQPLTEAETRTISIEQQHEEKLILQTLTLLHRLYQYSTVDSSNLDIEPFHVLLFQRVLPLVYMGHNRQRAPALKVFNQALKTNLISYVKEKRNDVWIKYKNALQNVYCRRMLLLVKATEHDWSNLWCLSIKLLGIDLHRGAELINSLLSVEEKAFKSSDMMVRKKAFESWKLLIDNFALDISELATSRRIKLLCIPLNAKNSKIEIVAVTKLQTWWHLIVKLHLNVDKLLNQVIGQYLNFCFGPLGDTPLLSKKCDVMASPGKRFLNTKLMAVDTLFQLLIQNPLDRRNIPCFITERLPNSVPSSVFHVNYKSLLHSVGEAILLINDELNRDEWNDPKKLNEMLWTNLMMYIQQSSAESKADMYKELILILGEVLSYIGDSQLITSLLHNSLVDQLVKVSKYLTYGDTTLMDLLLKILSLTTLANADKKFITDLMTLIRHAIKPKNTKTYHCDTLTFIKSVLKRMKTLIEHDASIFVFELWYTLAEIMTKYLEQNQPINEGTSINHCFESIQSLIVFPIQYVFYNEPESVIKIGKIWRKLYKKFDMEADLITTVKPNEILHNVTTIMENSFAKDKRCYSIIAHCLDSLMSTINYNVFLSENKIPPLINILRDITIAALSDTRVLEIEFSLKAISSLLITIYGLNQKCTLMYLDILKPSIENVLEIKDAGIVEKEILNTWETVVIIFRGLAKSLTHEFILSYQKVILLALSHNNCEIAGQAISLINIKNDLNKEAKAALEIIEKEANKSSGGITNAVLKNEALPMPIKIAGSFINHKMPTTKAVSGNQKNCEQKKSRITTPPPPPPPEPDSQDYVVIKNNITFDINRLTEHQKEILKRHRDDIPAMYNELSQSASHNTQEFEDWFKNKSKVIKEKKDDTETAHNNIIINCEANKENDASGMDTIDNNNEKSNYSKIGKIIDDNKETNNIEINQKENIIIPLNDADVQIHRDGNEKNNIIDSQMDTQIDDKLHIALGKESNDKKNTAHSSTECYSRLTVEEFQQPVEQVKITHGKSLPLSQKKIDGDDNNDDESQSLESLHAIRRGRSRSKFAKANEKLSKCTKVPINTDNQTEQCPKRKTEIDDEIEELSRNKCRRNAAVSQSSSDTVSDSEAINEVEDENHSVLSHNDDLPKRTKKEMSRLQINMVFNCRTPSKLRSKPADDFIYSSNTKKQRNVKNSDNSIPENISSQELLKKRKQRKTRSLFDIKTESLNKVQTHSTENESKNSEIVSNAETIKENEKQLNTAIESSEAIENNENTNLENRNEVNEMSENIDKSKQVNAINNSPSTSKSNFNIVPIEDEEEVVESSQTPESLIRSPRTRNSTERISVVSSVKISPTKGIICENSNHMSSNANLISQQPENIRKLPHDELNKTTSTNSNFSSPKSIKRLSKSKSFMPQGRTAHMLSLVTKFAIGEKNESNENTRYSEDETNKKLKFSKELEEDYAVVKNERTLILKETDHIGSPSGSRQEKIFNNMKAKDYASPPSTKLFSNLKNDGEKISPKYEKAMATDAEKISDKVQNMDNSMSFERDELPILEWSSANAPSLTASPNASILKRQRQTSLDIDNDMPANKRKRVSFADPPVSREMGYEVMSGTSPIKINKTAQPRVVLIRKDSPNKIRYRKIRIDVEKSDQLSCDKLNESASSDRMDTDHEGSQLMKTEDSQINLEICDKFNLNSTDDCDSEINKTSDIQVHVENLSVASTVDVYNIEIIDDRDVDESDIKEIQSHSSTPQKNIPLNAYNTSTNISETDKNNDDDCENDELRMIKSEEIFTSKTDDSDDSSKFNITDDSTIARILNGSGGSCKSNNLDDTVDIENVSNLNFSGNSDETFSNKLTRTSTQIAAMSAIAQNDTLPVTDSMFLSQGASQNNLATQQSLILSQPHTMDTSNPICPSLLDCNEPINTIINDLVNPMWVKNLSKYFNSRGISTVSDLARLSEREAARFPVKGSPKVNYIKNVLNKFSMSRRSLLKDETAEEIITAANEAVCSTPRAIEKRSKILDETHEDIENYDDGDNNETDNITTLSLSPVNQSLIDHGIIECPFEIVRETLEKDTKPIKSNDYGSIILDTSLSPLPKNSMKINETKKSDIRTAVKVKTISSNTASPENHFSPQPSKSVETQLNFIDLLDAIDPNILLKSAMKQNTPETIITQYKIKMKHQPEAEFTKETLKMLGLPMCTETELKNACREYGLTKVLGQLPTIFNADNKFFTKVLNAYRMKITADDCINTLDFNEFKKAICKKCSPSELCEMLSTVLINEEKNGNNTPITDASCLNAMLKRMPLDTIISHTVANDELIPSSFVLEIALQNNSPDTIAHAVDAQFPNIVENIMNRNQSVDAIISYINNNQLSEEKLLEIHRAVSNQINPNTLIDAHGEILKQKININANELQ